MAAVLTSQKDAPTVTVTVAGISIPLGAPPRGTAAIGSSFIP